MTPFGDYARYYDACYAGKDYGAECDFLEAALAAGGKRPEALLDLACGTGGHGLEMTRRGYRVSGVDRSPAMLGEYRSKAIREGVAVDLHEQDMRQLSLGREFDAAFCMFDALSYLTENADLAGSLRRIRSHVRPGGVLVFDFWHAAPLLRGHDPVRVREFPLPGGRGIRVTETSVDVARQVATVRIRVLAFEGDRLTADLSEDHPMRFFLPQEMAFILEATGWELLQLCPAFDLHRPVDADAWHLCAVARPALG